MLEIVYTKQARQDSRKIAVAGLKYKTTGRGVTFLDKIESVLVDGFRFGTGCTEDELFKRFGLS